jgi:hypothetical protein
VIANMPPRQDQEETELEIDRAPAHAAGLVR